MTFINSIQTIIRKSNENILNFYVNDGILLYREFTANKGWDDPQKLISNIKLNQYNIKIDTENKVYGIAHTKKGEIIYIYTKNNAIEYKELFNYDTEKYSLKYPFIQKIDSTIQIMYYIQDISDRQSWGIINHYYDGNEWIQNNLDSIKAYPIINPFIISNEANELRIFYFNKLNGNEEIFTMKFHPFHKQWSKPIQITDTKNGKLHLNVLNDNYNSYNITWNEFINNNLVVRFMKGSFEKDLFTTSKILSLSEPSNCSFPTLILTGNTMWNIWVQMNKLMSCYSFDNGENWSEPSINRESTKSNFIRYKFSTNLKDDLTNFRVNTIFGTYYPQISFIGFKNFKPK